MALAKVLQAYTKESGYPTGVPCDPLWEQQRYMTPLLALNGNEISWGFPPDQWEENAESPLHQRMEAALLGDIKHEIELPWVPEPLEVHEQVQPAEQAATPTASLPSRPSQPSHFPPQKAK